MNIPCCFFPTKIIFLDDDPMFLTTMDAAIGKYNILKLFKVPEELINYLKSRVLRII